MNPLQQLQEDSLNYLLGNPTTAAVPYTTIRKQTIESAAVEAMAAWKVRVPGKIGVTCMILMPSARSQYPDVPGPQFFLELIIRTFEDPKVNNTTYSAEDVAMENLRWLDGLAIGDVTIYAPHEQDAVRPVYDYPGFLVYDSILKCACPQDYVGRTQDPTLTDNGDGTITLGCGDLAAVIYYTLDGTMPTPGNQAQVYPGGPIERPAIGQVVTFLAWNPNILPSAVPRAYIET